MLNVIMLSRQAECRYAAYIQRFVFTLRVILPSVVMLNDIMLAVVILSIIKLFVAKLGVIILSVVMQKDIMLIVVMLNIILLFVVMLSVIILGELC
jgi:hypothetical protein